LATALASDGAAEFFKEILTSLAEVKILRFFELLLLFLATALTTATALLLI
jgi:hypothetical protein